MNDTTNPLEDPKRFPGTAVWVAGGLVLFLLAVGLYFRAVPSPPGAGVDVAAVTESPEDFVGRTVTVQGKVERVIGARAFVLEDEGPGGEMLVVTGTSGATPQIADLEDADEIRVIGEVRQFDAAKVQSEVGVAASDDRLEDVKDKPVLYAFQVVRPPAKAEEHARTDAATD